MYLHVLLKYNARVAARAEQLTRRRVEIHDLTRNGIMTRPIIELDWGESSVTTDHTPSRNHGRPAYISISFLFDG
jgi:hypothetical protein